MRISERFAVFRAKFHQALNLKNVALVIVYVALFAGLVEGAGRFYLSKILHKAPHHKYQFDSYRLFAHVPGFREGENGRDWIVINNQGFRRSQDVSKEKPKGTYRIFFMGGSAAHGVSSAAPYPIEHVYMDETIDANLERMLKAKYPSQNFEVINAAVVGYQTFQHTAYIESELLNYQPDLFIFFDGVNDHFVTDANGDMYAENQYQFWRSRLQQPSFSGLLDYASLELSQYSAAARAYSVWRGMQDAMANEAKLVKLDPKKTPTDELIRQHRIAAQRTFLRAIDTNLLLSSHFGASAVLALQPILGLRKEANLSAAEAKFFGFKDETTARILYPTVVEELAALAAAHGVDLVDLNVPFNADDKRGKQLFIDYCHLNAPGSALAATALFPTVEKAYLSAKAKQEGNSVEVSRSSRAVDR